MDKVQIIPPPKDVDPKFLAWKGAAVLGKMDSVADLWLTPADWVRISVYNLFRPCLIIITPQDLLGMRGLKERCFYL
jgi:actin-related protein 8